MNSMVIGEFFSKASTTIWQHQHHRLLWLSNTWTGMVVLQPHPQQWPGNDIKPAHLLMHKFIPMPLVGQNNGIFLAYELEDVSLRDHLFQLGMLGHCLPYQEVGDVVIVRNSSDKSFSMAIVRSVFTPGLIIL